MIGSRESKRSSKFAAVQISYREKLEMTISITLTPDQERVLEELAHQSGKDPSNYVSDLVTVHLDEVMATTQKSFEEILAPVWEGWRQSGMSEEEINDLFQRELQELRRERHESKDPT
jgi:predicted DNA-binding protein